MGSSWNIASLTATTVVVTLLANSGGYSSGKFQNRFLFRSNAASVADLVRRCTDFTAVSGTLTHPGPSYSDTTATSEVLDILEYEPRLFDDAIQTVLSILKRRDRYILPCVPGEWYDIGALTWIRQPADIMEVKWSPSPILNNNYNFGKWGSYDSSGNLVLDNWTFAGSGGTLARASVDGNGYPPQNNASWLAKLTRSGTNVTLTQNIGILSNGVESLASNTVSISALVWSNTASAARISIADGTAETNSSYHTGSGLWEELTVEFSMAATASILEVKAKVDVNSDAYLNTFKVNLGSVSDAVRRDNYPEYIIPVEDYDFDQINLRLRLPQRGYGGHYVIYSKREYAHPNDARFYAGSAEADVIDAPVDIVAVGAIARVYFALAQRETEKRKEEYMVLYRKWWLEFSRLARGHLGVKAVEPGVNFNRRRSLIPAARGF